MFKVASQRLANASKGFAPLTSAHPAQFTTKAERARQAAAEKENQVYPDALPPTSHRYNDPVNMTETPIMADQLTNGAPIKYMISDTKKSYVLVLFYTPARHLHYI